MRAAAALITDADGSPASLPVRRRQAGQSLVETALVLPLLLFVLFGAIEMGRVANVQQTLVNAAREGARWSAMPEEGTQLLPALGEVQQRVIDFAAKSDLTLSDSNVLVTQRMAKIEGGLPVGFSSVTVTYTYGFTTPMLAAVLPSLTLKAQAAMRNENN